MSYKDILILIFYNCPITIDPYDILCIREVFKYET